MYTERDMSEIRARIRKNWIVLTPFVIAIIAGYIYALHAGIKWLAMVLGPLLFVVICYGILAYLMPNTRYKTFLQDLEDGLNRDVRGTIVEISDKAEMQDGAMVLPVRVRLDPEETRDQASKHTSTLAGRLRLDAPDDAEEERIVYLNASKRDQFPAPGAKVTLHCCGRHVKSVELTP